MSLKRIAAVATGVTVVLGLALTLKRLFLGVGLEDEAMYVGIPYRFFLGDRPFVDELSVSQTASLLVYPFVALYVHLTGGTDGLLLFGRFLYIAFALAVGGGVFVVCRRFVSTPVAALIGLIHVIHIPGNVPGPSYHNLGTGFLTLAILPLAARWLEGRETSRLTWFSLSYGLAVIAFPPLLLAYLVLGAILVGLARGRRLRAALQVTVPALLLGTLLLVAFRIHPGDLWSAARAALRILKFQTYDLSVGKFELLCRGFLPPLWPLIPLAVGAAAFTLRRFPRWALPAIALGLVPVLAAVARGPSGGPGYTLLPAYLGLLFPFAAPLAGDTRLGRLMLVLWVPALVAGGVIAWSSRNGAPWASLGLAPAAYLTLAFLGRALERRGQGVWAPVACLAVLALFLRQLNALPGVDGRRGDFSHRIPSGPYAGIRTNASAATLLSDLQAAVARYGNPTGRVLFYPVFPAGYLMTTMRPAAEIVYQGDLGFPQARDYRYVRELRADSVAFRVFQEEMWRDTRSTLDRFLREHQREHPVSDRITVFTGNREG